VSSRWSPIGFLGYFGRKSSETLGFPGERRKRHAETTKSSGKSGICLIRIKSNTVAPTLVEHTVYAGLSWNLTEDFTLSITYLHAFEDAIAGPLLTPAGAVPGTSVRNTCSGDSLQIGATVKFGGCGTPPGSDCPAPQWGCRSAAAFGQGDLVARGIETDVVHERPDEQQAPAAALRQVGGVGGVRQSGDVEAGPLVADDEHDLAARQPGGQVDAPVPVRGLAATAFREVPVCAGVRQLAQVRADLEVAVLDGVRQHLVQDYPHMDQPVAVDGLHLCHLTLEAGD